MSDVLSAASLLLAVLGVLYGLWYREMIKALSTQSPRHAEDMAQPRGEVAAMIASRALPLAASSLLTVLVFLPDAVRIALYSSQLLREVGLRAYLAEYNSVASAFVLVEFMAIGIAVQASFLLVKLAALVQRLSPGTRHAP